MLPVVPLPVETFQLGGSDVRIRSLSRLEVIKLKSDYQGREEAGEVFVLACSLDIAPEEAEAWLQATPQEPAGLLIQAVLRLSGLQASGSNSPQ